MKVVDPQSAALTTTEVHHFLTANVPRKADKRIGSYKSVNLDDYHQVRKDFEHYVETTIPYIKSYPSPETYMSGLASKLCKIGLTKTEALMLINLGTGLDKPKAATTEEAAELTNGEAAGDAEMGDEVAEGEEEVSEVDHAQQLSLVIEELQERFPGEEGEQKVQQILDTMKQYLQPSGAADEADIAASNNDKESTTE